MFTFGATPVKFIGLLVLFVWCTLWCAYELTRPQDTRQRISNVLHLVMALVMLAMVPGWSWQALVSVVPTPVLVGVFALGTAWFVWLALAAFRSPGRAGVGHFAGHAAMFGAMTWHLAAMATMASAMAHPQPGPGMGDMGDAGGMGGLGHPMDMGEWMAAQSRPGGLLWDFALVGLPFMAYLLFAGINAVRQALQSPAPYVACPCGDDCSCGPDCTCQPSHADDQVRELALVGAGALRPVEIAEAASFSRTCHEVRPVGTPKFRLAAASDFAMNVGMFWMSTGLLVPIVPFFALLAF